VKLTVGVYGSASGEIPRQVRQKVREVGRAIAKRGYVLLTGACPGIPYEAVVGCKRAGGMTVGVSPALNLYEHTTRYQSPAAGFDVIVYTGDGLMGREVTAVRSCDVVIFAGGRSGTLGEFAIAYDEGKTIGVLTDTGGISDHIPEIVALVNKETDAVLVTDDRPTRLLSRLVRAHRERGPIEHIPTGA
jgi:uncharacterized protein (TIGR00725 family)